MFTKKSLTIILVASVVILAAGFGLQGSGNALALAQALPQSLPLAQNSETIPYSGSLTDQAGQLAADGAYQFRFTLYTYERGGEPLWTELQEGVIVQKGGFSVLLGSVNPLPKAALDGGARWLEVEVRGPGEKEFTALSPRQELSAATPAAAGKAAPDAVSCIHDHLYENWDGSSASYSFKVTNESTGDGIRGVSYSTAPDFAGVVGASYGGGGTGVYGLSYGGDGVVGMTTDTTGNTRGVWGESASNSGIGVVGKSTSATGNTTGVWGEMASSGAYARAIVGWATKTSGVNYGMWGQSESSAGTGVYGSTQSATCSSSHYGTCSGVKGASNQGNGTSGITQNGTALFAYVNGTGKGLEIWTTGSGNLIEAWKEGAPSDKKFQVDNAGNVTADGTYTSPASDFAEMLPAVPGLEPGDVLVVGADGQLTRSSKAFQPTVVGIYSTKPGFVGGGELDQAGKAPLAVVGVVPVKVSAENGAIQPGDLLVASATPGHAMKAGADPVVGTVIGKALAAWESGTGVILILVMLQ